MQRRKTEKEKEEEEPIRSIFCLKNKELIREVEEEEECFILGFDPFEEQSTRFSKLSLGRPDVDQKDLVIVAEKGQVACRDYPHPRHLCARFPFDKTPHHRHCDKCYCSICDEPAPCPKWRNLGHCDFINKQKAHNILADDYDDDADGYYSEHSFDNYYSD